MPKKICEEICPYCKSNKDTVFKRRPQCYCKKCKKYFIPGSKRDNYSVNAALVFNTINKLLYPQNIKRIIDLNHFTKKLLQTAKPTNDIKIKYQTIETVDNLKTWQKFLLMEI